MPKLNRKSLRRKAADFARHISGQKFPELYGVTDGKKIATWFEDKFLGWLEAEGYTFSRNGATLGIDLPELKVDIKLTKADKPQSSLPFKSPMQKIFGLGYALLIFYYRKDDDRRSRTGSLNIADTWFVDNRRTADHTTTTHLKELVAAGGTKGDIVRFLREQKIPATAAELQKMAGRILASPPAVGHIGVSNALQWRAHYGRLSSTGVGESGVWRL